MYYVRWNWQFSSSSTNQQTLYRPWGITAIVILDHVSWQKPSEHLEFAVWPLPVLLDRLHWVFLCILCCIKSSFSLVFPRYKNQPCKVVLVSWSTNVFCQMLSWWQIHNPYDMFRFLQLSEIQTPTHLSYNSKKLPITAHLGGHVLCLE